jgi:hypothetical protein
MKLDLIFGSRGGIAYKTWKTIGYPGDAIIDPMGPSAFTMHNLAPRLILHFCKPAGFITIVILHPCSRIRKAYFFILYEDHVYFAELS